MYKYIPILFFLSCNRPPVIPELLPRNDDPSLQCTSINTCNVMTELVPLLVPLLVSSLPPGPQGVQGEPGAAGQSVTVNDLLPSIVPLLPQGPPGAQGLSGRDGVAANTVLLTASSAREPEIQYNGTANLNSLAVFVPKMVWAVQGNHKAFVYLDFGVVRCTYQNGHKNHVDKQHDDDCDDDRDNDQGYGNNHVRYRFVSCKNVSNVVVLGMVPTSPFAFSGTVTLSVGEGNNSSDFTQVVTFLQVQ